jgi:hypothetical protein
MASVAVIGILLHHEIGAGWDDAGFDQAKRSDVDGLTRWV